MKKFLLFSSLIMMMEGMFATPSHPFTTDENHPAPVVAEGGCYLVMISISSIITGDGPPTGLATLWNEDFSQIIDSQPLEWTEEATFYPWNVCLPSGCYQLTVEGDCCIDYGANYFIGAYSEDTDVSISSYNIINDTSGSISLSVNSNCWEEPLCSTYFTFAPGDACGEVVFATEHFVEGTPFMWHFGDGVSMLGGAVISHVYESPGFYIVNCVYVNQVCNGYQLSEVITVEECEEACTASFEVQLSETPGQFTLVNTSSPMSQDVEWVWSLGNGQQSTDTDVDVTYTFSDEYEVCLVMYSDECVSAYCQDILVEGLQTKCIPVDASITSYYTQGSGPEVIHWLLATDDGNALESGQLQFDYLPTYNINLCLMNNCYILSLEGSNVAGQFVDLSIEALNASAIQHIEAPNENLMRVCFGVQAACTIGTDEMSASSALVAYPNPAQDVLYITGNEKWQRLELVDMIGQLVWSTLPNAPITRLDVAHLAAGVYIIKAQTEHTSLTKRIVIEH